MSTDNPELIDLRIHPDTIWFNGKPFDPLRKAWIETQSGRFFSLSYPQPIQIDIDDIVVPLARNARFVGQTLERKYTVAEHLLRGYYFLLRQIKDRLGPTHKGNHDLILGWLLHDAHEAYSGDISRPMKSLLNEVMPHSTEVGLLTFIEARITAAIYEKFNVTLNEEECEIIAKIDCSMLKGEAAVLMPSAGRDWNWTFDDVEAPPYTCFGSTGSATEGGLWQMDHLSIGEEALKFKLKQMIESYA